MLEQRTLADVIQSKVALGNPNPRGYIDVRCPMCHDQKDRGGFKFDEASTGYNCYNCQAKFKYEEGSGKLSKNARQILEAFGITKDDLMIIRSAMFAAPKEETEISLDELKKVKLITPEVPLPEKSYPLGSDHHDELQAPLIEYLLERKIDPLEVKAYFSLDHRYIGRVIIPYYRDGKIIYWQARRIDGEKQFRYLNSPAAKDAVMYGYDRLYSYDPAPLFVNEGVFDAIVLNGISILGSSLTPAKIEILKKCRRRVIFVIDRDKTGGELAKAVLENGWELSFVDKRASDANRSVQLFGLPFTIYTLMKNVTRNLQLTSLGVTLGKLGAYR